MKFFARANNKSYEIEVDDFTENFTVHLGNKLIKAELQRVSQEGLYSLLVDNRSYQLFIEENSQGCEVIINGRRFLVELEDEKTRLLQSLIKTDKKSKGQMEVKAPMPGLIAKIEVEEGQKIKKGDGLLIIEAMKMENEIRANVGGVVKKVLTKEKESVEKDMILMVIE
ncbi:MAG: acetyl-CoA carboxylase biotin carboxyl carrier protein subunit [bacterium]